MERNGYWIKTEQKNGEISPEFRKTHTLRGAVKKATATVTAMGVYHLYVNGVKAGDAVMAPYWTSYQNRVQEQSYDITDLLQEENVFGILLGKGWAMGRIGYSNQRHFTGYFAENLSLIANIRVEYADGSVEEIGTDESWQVFSSQILDSEI